MRTGAFILGMFGGFAGVYFALVLVAGTALFAALAPVFGGRNSDQAFQWGLAALACYTVGIIGGALSLQRPGLAALLMAAAAVGGVGATVGIGPAALSSVSPSASAVPTRAILTSPPRVQPTSTPIPSSAPVSVSPYLAIPLSGPALLVAAAILAAAGWRNSRRSDRPAPAI